MHNREKAYTHWWMIDRKWKVKAEREWCCMKSGNGYRRSLFTCRVTGLQYDANWQHLGLQVETREHSPGSLCPTPDARIFFSLHFPAPVIRAAAVTSSRWRRDAALYDVSALRRPKRRLDWEKQRHEVWTTDRLYRGPRSAAIPVDCILRDRKGP